MLKYEQNVQKNCNFDVLNILNDNGKRQIKKT
jgi:hypothetical protein